MAALCSPAESFSWYWTCYNKVCFDGLRPYYWKIVRRITKAQADMSPLAPCKGNVNQLCPNPYLATWMLPRCCGLPAVCQSFRRGWAKHCNRIITSRNRTAVFVL